VIEGSEKGKNEEGKGWRCETNYCFSVSTDILCQC